MDIKKRSDGRQLQEIRDIHLIYDAFGYSDASVLYCQGKTKILVTVTLQQGVPQFLKGQRKGWLTAEYSMLPTATHQRVQRETQQTQRNYRNIEISRLIGRCLRAVVDLAPIGERSILVDCDVLQADGGTRVASITAASLALNLAVERWMAKGLIDRTLIKHSLAALSVGVVNTSLCVDLCYEEDAIAEADFNIIATTSGAIVEIQGTAEKEPISQGIFDELKTLGLNGIQMLVERLAALPKPFVEMPVKKIHRADLQVNSHGVVKKDRLVSPVPTTQSAKTQDSVLINQSAREHKEKSPFFSLSSRFKQPE